MVGIRARRIFVRKAFHGTRIGKRKECVKIWRKKISLEAITVSSCDQVYRGIAPCSNCSLYRCGFVGTF